ncbi:ORF44 [Ranid herpesvirus 1]|uniref:ORF44 n=1 Tax=Ranid herpesvirus 1 TaxID=85655 RepID=Q14VR4_9VIRU|nr:ORF44 [Ranid herpesvirus 1]ABG25749.1 ORF44 [Ranid herpesvirus 1]
MRSRRKWSGVSETHAMSAQDEEEALEAMRQYAECRREQAQLRHTTNVGAKRTPDPLRTPFVVARCLMDGCVWNDWGGAGMCNTHVVMHRCNAENCLLVRRALSILDVEARVLVGAVPLPCCNRGRAVRSEEQLAQPNYRPVTDVRETSRQARLQSRCTTTRKYIARALPLMISFYRTITGEGFARCYNDFCRAREQKLQKKKQTRRRLPYTTPTNKRDTPRPPRIKHVATQAWHIYRGGILEPVVLQLVRGAAARAVAVLFGEQPFTQAQLRTSASDPELLRAMVLTLLMSMLKYDPVAGYESHVLNSLLYRPRLDLDCTAVQDRIVTFFGKNIRVPPIEQYMYYCDLEYYFNI